MREISMSTLQFEHLMEGSKLDGLPAPNMVNRETLAPQSVLDSNISRTRLIADIKLLRESMAGAISG